MPWSCNIRLMATRQPPKYQQLIDTLEQKILSGQYKARQKLPSEAALVEQFGASRITVGRALRDLQQRHLVDRRAGSGTYVRADPATPATHLFGLLIPDLGQTEIFEPICRGIAGALDPGAHALLWGNLSTEEDAGKEEQAYQLCQQFIARKVS